MKNIFVVLAVLSFLAGGCFLIEGFYYALGSRPATSMATSYWLIQRESVVLLCWILGALWLVVHRLWYPRKA